jgi:hypothetical protein
VLFNVKEKISKQCVWVKDHGNFGHDGGMRLRGIWLDG